MNIETNVTAVDAWTLVHIAVTFVLGYILGRLSTENRDLKKMVVIGYWSVQAAIFIGSLIIIVWEIGVQHNAFTFMGCVEESPINYITDIVIGFLFLMIGYSRGKK